jgi:hypothetical protein
MTLLGGAIAEQRLSIPPVANKKDGIKPSRNLFCLGYQLEGLHLNIRNFLLLLRSRDLFFRWLLR